MRKETKSMAGWGLDLKVIRVVNLGSSLAPGCQAELD